jgi:hypothetical protein
MLAILTRPNRVLSVAAGLTSDALNIMFGAQPFDPGGVVFALFTIRGWYFEGNSFWGSESVCANFIRYMLRQMLRQKWLKSADVTL